MTAIHAGDAREQNAAPAHVSAQMHQSWPTPLAAPSVSIMPTAAAAPVPTRASLGQRLLRKRVLARMGAIRTGGLEVHEGTQVHRFGSDPAIRLEVHHPRFWTASALGGSVGAGASYIDGCWDCDDLTGLIRLLCRNRTALDGLDSGLGSLVQPVLRLLHALNRNSIEGAARNIRAHYDLGNAFFARMLDPSLMYSAARYPHPQATLGEAQEAKCRHIGDLLDLHPGDEVVEIGSGWGGFALHAANRGARVTTTTISAAQHELAAQRFAAAGQKDRITLLDLDWRTLTGSFQKLVSIEMIEAIGHRAYPGFFKKCQDLLRPDGLAVIQCITIADQRYAAAAREVDFIKRFIFPGSCIPSVEALVRAATKASDLRLVRLEDQTPHYARTLADWRTNCRAEQSALRGMGYGGRFERLWEFYLAYCEGAFAERAIGSVQMVFARPDWRPAEQSALGY